MPTSGELLSVLSLAVGGGVIGTTIKALFDKKALGATADQTVVTTATSLVTKLEGLLEKAEATNEKNARERREQDERIEAHLRWDRQARWLCEVAQPPVVLGPAPPLYAPFTGDRLES